MSTMWTRVVSRVMAAVVAAVAGVISYGHIRQVAAASGELEIAAALLPVGIDGLIIVGTLAMLEDKRQRRYPRLSARIALGFGIAATVGFNIASAEPVWSARAVAVVPAVSFLLAVEVLVRTGRPMPDDTTHTPAGESAPAASADVPVVASSRSRKVRRSSRSGSPRPSAAQRVREAVAATPHATSAEIAARLGLSERTVQRYRPKPATTAPAGAAVDKPTPAVDKSTSTVDNTASGSAGGDSAPDLFASNGMVPLVGTVSRAPLTREVR